MPRRQTGASPIIDVSEFLERYPKSAVAAYKKGIDAESKGKVSEAVKSLEDAVKIASGFFQAHNALGVAYRKAGRIDEAESEFLK